MSSKNGDVRHRRRGGKKKEKTPESSDDSFEQYSSTNFNDVLALFKFVSFIVGTCVMVYVGKWYTIYMQNLHENQLWFTNIKQVEREISLRTECGLYYSYFKQMLAAPNLEEGFRQLTVDNATEHGRTINILQRFNVYQEVILASLYRYFDLSMDAILFYVYSIFTLTGFYISTVFSITWYLTGSWLSGLLTATFLTVNLEDSTRVFFTVNLREAFAFPFLGLQLFFTCVYLNRSPNRFGIVDPICQIGTLLSGFAFALMWQFNQFVFLLQAAALYSLAVLQLVATRKVVILLVLQAMALLGVWAFQFGQPMVLGSLVLSFIPAAIFILILCRKFGISGGIVAGVMKIGFQLFLTALLTGIFNLVVKYALNLEADAHIFKFIKGKFGFSSPRDFESRIYLCHGAFQYLENHFFYRTSLTLAFPLYLSMASGVFFLLGKDIILEWCSIIIPSNKKYTPLDPSDPTDKEYYCNRHPSETFLVIQSFLVGLMAMMTLRMKYLWFPHMAILASLCVSEAIPNMVQSLLDLVKIKKKIDKVLGQILTVTMIVFLVMQYKPTYDKQMDDLKEFYDPDTVQLMEWINNNTKPDASFTGSMQLLAGVKACTGRHLINHPHFEDKWLRERTKKVYQIYGRRTPDDVYKIMKEEKTDFIILEDSICLAPSEGCRTPDLIDFDNSHVPDSGANWPGLIKVKTPRFCDEIRYGYKEYTKYFELVLENPTFRVYRVL